MPNDINKKLLKLNEESHVCAHEVLQATARWLEDPNNEIYSLLEDNESSLNIAAEYCVLAAHMLKKASTDIEVVSGIEYKEKGVIDALESLRIMADAFDESENEELQKKASVLSEIMNIISNDAIEQKKRKEAYDKRIEQFKNKLNNKLVEKSAQEISDKKPELQGNTLSTRYCPDHKGVSTYRKSDSEWQCPIDGKIYNYKDGFVDENGTRHPGSSVEKQTDLDNSLSNAMVYK